jgi:quercetin dioxygenase-like cupin family protein
VQTLFPADAIAPIQVWEGVTVRVVTGDRMTMAIAELEPNIVVPWHVHEHEQLGTIVAGSARFLTEEDSQELGVGATYRLLSKRPHKVEVGPEGAVFIEAFCPTREDWHGLPAVLDHITRWPDEAALTG